MILTRYLSKVKHYDAASYDSVSLNLPSDIDFILSSIDTTSASSSSSSSLLDLLKLLNGPIATPTFDEYVNCFIN